MANYYIGLMSGTSADGIDLALVDFSNNKPQLIATSYSEYDQQTRGEITSLYTPSDNEIERLGRLDKKLAHLFAHAVNALLTQHNLTTKDIQAIGNHGQTIRHRPTPIPDKENTAFTLQIGCSQTLACLTSVPVIGKFRDKDIALGGQGAPLVPAFHQYIVNDKSIDQIIVNIGGIANLSYLPKDSQKHITGFDTGPGNCLLDEWFTRHHLAQTFDKNGDWAASGNVIPSLLEKLLSDDYFKRPAPKSTGREIFHQAWLLAYLANENYLAEDIQATLAELSAVTIAQDIKSLTTDANIWLCGGGRLNNCLVNRLKKQLPNYQVETIEQIGIDGDALEAMAFAWLAYAYNNNIFSNIPAVTGARKSTTLGVLFTP